ncbi:GTP-binding protein [Xylanimonas allomyrinae]|uniref:GTP-binding protein n=1 Tax=Xylanimonas allomyrinae TaxID=2509459 RepID=UPI001FE4DD82|nr:GTP-binding protein [Xylanimonas allomyrinae]
MKHNREPFSTRRLRAPRSPAPGTPEKLRLSVLAAIDPVLRDAAVTGIVLGSPGTVAVRHDLLVDDGALRRVVVDASGVVEDALLPLEHACLSCCVREDAIPTLTRLADDGRWTDAVLALPATAEPIAVVRALEIATEPGGPLARYRLATTAAVADVDTLEEDLLGDQLCGDRGLELADDDERSVGEALAAQLEQADLVVTTGTSPTGLGLVDRLRGEGTTRTDGLHHLDAADLAALRHDPVAAERRANPLRARGADAIGGAHGPGGDRSWTLVLDSSQAFDPERLLAQVEALGTGRIRSRGVFHVANRPDSACLWDSAGGQTCIAGLGPWGEAMTGSGPRTRICVVGAGDDADAQVLRQRISDAFRTALATPGEAADGGLRWLGRDDVLAPWLGERTAV